jgi:hypothetical protein
MRTRAGEGPEGAAGVFELDVAPAEDAWHQIRVAIEEVAEARSRLEATVREARAEGLSWAAIGEAMGISRQAAQKRFSMRAD